MHRVVGDQVKSEVDIRAHGFLLEGLRRIIPGIAVISEEDDAFDEVARPTAYWLIDPLDGTKSYLGGYTGYVTQLALIEESAPILAAVHQPHTGDFYKAERGGGAYLNDRPIPLMREERPWVLTDNTPQPEGVSAQVYRGVGCGHYIESGSLGLKVCLVASGVADLFVKGVVLRDWDIAPAHLILSESGGCLTQVDGLPFTYSEGWEKNGVIAAGTTELHEAIVHCLHALVSGGEAGDTLS